MKSKPWLVRGGAFYPIDGSALPAGSYGKDWVVVAAFDGPEAVGLAQAAAEGCPAAPVFVLSEEDALDLWPGDCK